MMTFTQSARMILTQVSSLPVGLMRHAGNYLHADQRPTATTQQNTTYGDRTERLTIKVIRAGELPVTMIYLYGILDSASFRNLLSGAQALVEVGVRQAVVDLRDVVELGDAPPDPDDGWAALRIMARDLSGGRQLHLKLLCPQPQVKRTLERAGFNTFLEVHPDLETALTAFSN
jgi:anti-anti-sigma regulatory factor